MVYKRYIKRGEKLCGPYYYESYRDKNGKVVSRYLKNYKPGIKIFSKRKKDKKVNLHEKINFKWNLLWVCLIILFCILGLFFVQFSGRVILEIDSVSETYVVGDRLNGSLILTIEEGDMVSNDSALNISLSKNETSLYNVEISANEFLNMLVPLNTTKEEIVCENITIEDIVENCSEECTDYEECMDVFNETTNETYQECEIKQNCTNVCINESVSSTFENCSVSKTEDFYFNQIGSYSRYVGEFLDYTFIEGGNYVFVFSSSELGVYDEKLIFVNESGEGGEEREFGTQSTPGDIDSCQELNVSGVYTMTANLQDEQINSTGCFNITASNVTLDCAGYFIRNTTLAKPGIYAENVVNVTVKNCNVTMSSSGYGIQFNKVNNSFIINNTANSNYDGIYLSSSSNNNQIISNTASNNFGSSGIYLSSSSNNTITNNLADSNVYSGIGLYSSSNNTVTNNIADSSTDVYGVGGGYGIYLSPSSNNNQIINNTANSNIDTGISLESNSNNNQIINNTVTLNINGISLISSSNNNILTGNIANLNSRGIYLSSSSENSLTNNNMSNNTYNFEIYGAENSHFNNTIDTSNIVDYSYKIYYNYSVDNYDFGSLPDAGVVVCAKCNNVSYSNMNLSHDNHYGAYFFNTTNSSLNNITSNSNYYGIILSSSSNNTLTGNTANLNVWDGIYIRQSSNNNLIANTANSNRRGIYLSSSSSNNILTENTMNSNSYHGIQLSSNSNNTLANNNIWSCTPPSYGCIYLYDSQDNTFIGGLINKSSRDLIYLSLNSNNNIFKDLTLLGATRNDTFVTGTSINNTFINVSYNNSAGKEWVASGSELIRKWYYRAYVNDTTGLGVSNANVSAYNVSGANEFTGLMTNGSGWTNITTITEYVNLGGVRSYYSNYTINSSKSEYRTNSIFRNITGNTVLSVTMSSLYDLSSCGVIDAPGVYNLINDVNSTSTCFNITVDDIILDGNGKTINYSNNGTNFQYGIFISGVRTNVTIINARIMQGNSNGEWNNAIYFRNNCTNITVYNNSITNLARYSTGIALRGGSLCNISDNTLVSYRDNSKGISSSVSLVNYTISNNNITANGTGIYLDVPIQDGLISNNDITSNYIPIRIRYSYSNRFLNNRLRVSNPSSSHSIGIYLEGSSEDIIDNNTIYVFVAGGWGIDSTMTNNTRISNNNITANGTGIYLNGLSTNNSILNNYITDYDEDGIDFHGSSFNNTVFNNTIIEYGGNGFCIFFSSSDSDKIFDNNITSFGVSDGGIYFISSSNATVSNNKISTLGKWNYGIYIGEGLNFDKIYNNTLITNGTGIHFMDQNLSNISYNNFTLLKNTSYAMYFSSSNSNHLAGNSIFGGNFLYIGQSSSDVISNNFFNFTSGLNFIFTESGIGFENLSFVNQAISSYSLNTPSNISFENTTGGKISFFGINGTGINLFGNSSSDIVINNNLVYVNSSKTGLNKSANITLYNLAIDWINPVILRDGQDICNLTTNPSCYNFTSLNAGNVSFNVSSWSNYSIIDLNLIDSCRVIDEPGVYTMTKNLENGDVQSWGCFNITASNVELNCGGYYIRNTTLAATGIYAENVVNVTIKNCNVSMSEYDYPDDGYGIKFSSVNDSYIINNTANSNMGGIQLSSSSNNQITNNTANSNNDYGIQLSSSSNNQLINNTANLNLYRGIYLSWSPNNTLSGITANSGDDHGVFGSNYGIYIGSSSNNILTGITANSNKYYGIYIGSSSNNILTGITANSNGYRGIYLTASANNTLTNNNIWNCTYGGCIYLSNSSNNTFLGGLINLSSSNLIYLKTNSSNNIFKDLTLLGATKNDTFLTTTSINNTFLNVSYNNSAGKEWVASGSELIRKWYLDVNVNDSVNPLNQSTVNSYNVSGNLIVSSLTNSSGNSRQELIEYVNNGGTKSYYSNYSVNASKIGYYGNSTYINMSDNSFAQLSLVSVPGASDDSGSSSGGGGSTNNDNVSETSEDSDSEIDNGIDITSLGDIETPFGFIGIRKGPIGCIPNWNCGEWGKCQTTYNLNTITGNSILLTGVRLKVCKDMKDCAYDGFQREKCEDKISIIIKNGTGCYEGYIMIYDIDNNLISILNLDKNNKNSLNIQFIFNNSNYCPSCYNKMMDNDETNVDCGGSCGECFEISKISKLSILFEGKFIILIFVLILLVLILLVYLFILLRRYLELRKISKDIFMPKNNKPKNSKLLAKKTIEVKPADKKPTQIKFLNKRGKTPILNKSKEKKDSKREKEIKKLRRLWYGDDA